MAPIGGHNELAQQTSNSSVILPRQPDRLLPERPEWLTAAEVAAHLKVQTRTVLAWTRQGKVKAYALSGTKRRVWRYLRSDVDSALFGNPVVSSVTASSVLSLERRTN